MVGSVTRGSSTATAAATRLSLLAQAAATRYNEAASCLPTKCKMLPNMDGSINSISPSPNDELDFTSLDIKTNGKADISADHVGITSRTLSSWLDSSPSSTTSSRGEFAPSVTALPNGDDDEGVVTATAVFFQEDSSEKGVEDTEDQEKEKKNRVEDLFGGAKHSGVELIAASAFQGFGDADYSLVLVQQEREEEHEPLVYEDEEEDDGLDDDFEVHSAPSKLEKTRWTGATANLLPKQPQPKQQHRSQAARSTSPSPSCSSSAVPSSEKEFDAHSFSASSWTSSLPSQEANEATLSFAQFGAREVQLGRQLGRGGFNDVYEVRSLSLQTTSKSAQEQQRVALAQQCLFDDGFPRFVVKFVRIHGDNDQDSAAQEVSSSASTEPKKNGKDNNDNNDEEDEKTRRRLARIRNREQVGATDLLTEATFLQSVVSDHPHIIQLRGLVFEEGENGITQGILLDRLYDTLEQRILRWKAASLSSSASSSFMMMSRRGSSNRRSNVSAHVRRSAVMGKSSSCVECLQTLVSQVLPDSWNHSLGLVSPHRKVFAKRTSFSASSPPWEQHEALVGQQEEAQEDEEEEEQHDDNNLKFRLRVALEIGSAIRHLHHHDVLHRDIKPANIGFDMEDRVKLFDFGLAYPLVSLEDGSRRRRPKGIAGAPRYMSREVAMGQTYGRPADCYSFSLVLWEIMSRHTPIFESITTRAELMSRVMTGGERPAIPNSSPLDWPPAVSLLIRAGWSPTPRERPTMEQYCAVLQRVLDELEFQQ